MSFLGLLCSRLLFVVASVACLALPAAAVPITIVFQGVVDGFREHPGDTDGSVGVGTAFEAVLTYDPSAPTFIFNSETQVFDAGYAAPPTEFSLRVGPWTIGVGLVEWPMPQLGDGVHLTVLKDGTRDLSSWYTSVREVEGLDTPIVPEYESRAELLFSGSAGILSSVSPDEIPLDLSRWPTARLILNLALPPFPERDPNDGIRVDGQITSIRVVPESATALSLSAGLVLLGLRRRGRNRIRRL